MGLFKSKEAKAFEKKQQTKAAARKITKHIDSLKKQKDMYIDRAKEAHIKGLASSYSIARSGIKATMIQLKRAGEMQLNLELLMQQRDFAALSGSFVKGMDIVSKELIKETGKIDFIKVSQQFNKAMGKSGIAADNLDDMLDNNEDAFSDISGTESISDSEIDMLIGIEAVEATRNIDRELDRLTGANSTRKSGDESFRSEMPPRSQSNLDAQQAQKPIGQPQKREILPPLSVPKNPSTQQQISSSNKFVSNAMEGEPQKLSEFLGQEKAITKLQLAIDYAKDEGEDIEDVLLTGGAGLGKSTLAAIIANEMGRTLIRQHASALRTKAELTNLIKKIKKGDIVFIDEIHELSDPLQTALLDALQDKRYAYSEGRGDKAFAKTLDVPSFTLIGATTHGGGLLNAFRGRFGNVVRLDPYEAEGLARIIRAQVVKKGKSMDAALAMTAGELCRGTPRRAKKYAKHILQIVGKDSVVTQNTLDKWRKVHEIDSLGLLAAERRLLEILAVDYKGEPASASTLSGAMQEEELTIIKEYEPHLINLGLIARTTRGRVARKKAFEHLGVPVPDKLAGLDESTLELQEESIEEVELAPTINDELPRQTESSQDNAQLEMNNDIRYKRGERAELEVAKALEENFDSNNYRVYNNIIFKNGERTFEIDHLVVSPQGIFVIETKDYKGTIEGFQSAELFFQHTDTPKAIHTFKNPILQNAGHIKALVETIGAYPYIGAVVFSDRSELKVKSTSFVGKISELVDYIKSNTDQLLDAGQIQKVHAKIEQFAITGEAAKELHKKYVEEIRRRKSSE